MQISTRDAGILRALASRQAELAASDKMRALYGEWERFGRDAPDARPMVRIELGTFADDIIPPLMRCEGAEARSLEWMLHSNMVNHTLFGDDTLVRDHIGVPMSCFFVPFGLEVKREFATDQGGTGLGHRFIPYLRDLERDFQVLGPSRFGMDRAKTALRIKQLDDLMGDILPVRYENDAMAISPMQNIVHIMSMEDMYVAMYDSPELFCEMMRRLTDDYCAWFDLMERERALTPTAGAQHLCQGSYCFTDALPDRGDDVRLKHIWLYMDSQETSSVSPEMFKTFVLPYYKKLAEKFGLLSYGCCEAVHELWEDGLDGIKNIGKVSVSPWCDEQKMGDALRGGDIVYLRKPTPNLLGVGVQLDEDAVRAHIRQTALAASGCRLEIAQRDVYQIHGTSDKARRYVTLIRETCDRCWHR